jgi:hypothetical protein
VYEEHPMNKGIVHAMAQSEKSLFMMALFVTTVTDSLRRNAKVIKNPLPLKRMWHRGPLRVKGIGEMKRSIEQRAWGRGRIGDWRFYKRSNEQTVSAFRYCFFFFL